MPTTVVYELRVRCKFCGDQVDAPHVRDACQWCILLRQVARFASVRGIERALEDRRAGLL